MIKPDQETVRMVAQLAQQYPHFRDFVNAWYNHELENLPSAVNHAAISQGRCQVLGELTRFINEAPDLAAKS